MTDDTRERLGDTLRWALESTLDPAMAAADWLARDIDPRRRSAVELLTNPAVELVSLGRAKEVFKTLRIVGETPADRRLGARLYAAAIAAGLAHHGMRITRQSDSAIRRALEGLEADPRMPPPLREMARGALAELARGTAKPPRALEDGDGEDEDIDLSLPELEDDEDDDLDAPGR